MPRRPDPNRKAVIRRDTLVKRDYATRRYRGTAHDELNVAEEREREYQRLLRPPPLPWDEEPTS